MSGDRTAGRSTFFSGRSAWCPCVATSANTASSDFAEAWDFWESVAIAPVKDDRPLQFDEEMDGCAASVFLYPGAIHTPDPSKCEGKVD
jgi:hypothetical protein